jgi:hypothetical protein
MRPEICKGCGGLKPALAIEQGDDFCSTECARRHYGTMTGGRRTGAPRPHALGGVSEGRPGALTGRPRTHKSE